MYWSAHAKERAKERFPDIDVESALTVARRPTHKRTKQAINRQRPAHKHEHFQDTGKYILHNAYEKIVFIIAAYPSPTVVTVFEYYP